MQRFQGLHVVSKDWMDSRSPRPPTLQKFDSGVDSSGGISNERATHRDWAWAYLWIGLALLAYAGVAWGMGWFDR